MPTTGNINARLYVVSLPNCLQTAVSPASRQWFCRENAVQRNLDGSVEARVDPRLVLDVVVGVQVDDFVKSNPQLAFLVLTIDTKPQFEIVRTKDQLQSIVEREIYSPAFPIRANGGGGTIRVLLRALGSGSDCNPYQAKFAFKLHQENAPPGAHMFVDKFNAFRGELAAPVREVCEIEERSSAAASHRPRHACNDGRPSLNVPYTPEVPEVQRARQGRTPRRYEARPRLGEKTPSASSHHQATSKANVNEEPNAAPKHPSAVTSCATSVQNVQSQESAIEDGGVAPPQSSLHAVLPNEQHAGPSTLSTDTQAKQSEQDAQTHSATLAPSSSEQDCSATSSARVGPIFEPEQELELRQYAEKRAQHPSILEEYDKKKALVIEFFSAPQHHVVRVKEEKNDGQLLESAPGHGASGNHSSQHEKIRVTFETETEQERSNHAQQHMDMSDEVSSSYVGGIVKDEQDEFDELTSDEGEEGG